MSLARKLADAARLNFGALAQKNTVTSADVDGTVNVKLAGDLVQTVGFQTGAVATGTTIIPGDDTIPQITEGTEVMTVAITPTNAANLLEIDVVVNLGCAGSANETMVAALFQDSTANALACGYTYLAANTIAQVRFRHRMTAGTTSATTFRVRFGGSAANTFTFNGSIGSRLYGGALISSITVKEYKA